MPQYLFTSLTGPVIHLQTILLWVSENDGAPPCPDCGGSVKAPNLCKGLVVCEEMEPLRTDLKNILDALKAEF